MELAAIESALTTADADQTGILSHRLKGAAASLGFKRLEHLIANPDPAAPGRWRSGVEEGAAAALHAYTRARGGDPDPDG